MLLIREDAITAKPNLIADVTVANIHVAHKYVADLYVGAMDEDRV